MLKMMWKTFRCVSYFQQCVLFHLWGVGGDGVEDVDEDEEEGDEKRHPAGDDVRRNHETDPRHNDEQTCSKPYFISTPVTLFYFE